MIFSYLFSEVPRIAGLRILDFLQVNLSGFPAEDDYFSSTFHT